MTSRTRLKDWLVVGLIVGLASCGLAPQQSPTPTPAWTDMQLPTLEAER